MEVSAFRVHSSFFFCFVIFVFNNTELSLMRKLAKNRGAQLPGQAAGGLGFMMGLCWLGGVASTSKVLIGFWEHEYLIVLATCVRYF